MPATILPQQSPVATISSLSESSAESESSEEEPPIPTTVHETLEVEETPLTVTSSISLAVEPTITLADSDAQDVKQLQNATLFMLARNSDVESAADSVRQLEEKFNKNFGYPWTFLNEVPFSEEFKQ